VRRVRSAAKEAIGPADAVIFRVPCQVAECLERSLRRSGHPYAVEVVGDPYEVFAPGSLHHPLRPLFRWYFPRQLRRHCAGACAAAYVTRHGLPSRYPCFSYSLSFSDIELSSDAFVSAPRIPDSAGRSFNLVTVGSLEQMYKAPDVLLDAVALCVRRGADVRLVLVGDGRHRPALEGRATALGLADCVVFLGQVATAEGVRAALDAADLFVLPSRTEGLPRALIEAMARALPCIGSRVGGIPELLPPEDLVEPGDAAGLADRILEVLASPARRAAMTDRNLARAAEYRPEILRPRLLDFLRRVRDRTQEWIEGGAKKHTVLLHVTTVPQSLNFLRAQIGYLRGRNFQIHVLSSPGASLDRFGSEQQVATHAVSMSRRITPGRDLVALWRLVHVLRRIRPDIVHGHTPKGGWLAMIAAWLNGVPVRLYHIHGLPLLTAAGLRRRLLRWTEKTACAFAQQVLCVSPSVREIAIKERICPEEKIRVLRNGSINGVDAEHFDPERLPLQTRHLQREQYGIPEQAVVLGFVGRIVRDKGIVELTHAWQSIRKEFPEAHLLLVGEMESQDPIPAETAAQLREDSRVHLVGVVRDMPPAYAAMDLVVLPTYREGFPVVPLEAAAMELPVLATHIPGCIDAIEDGITGTLVPPRDAEALAGAIRSYLLDPARRLQHGRNGRRRVLRDFQPDAMGQAVHDEYRRLISERAARVDQTFYQRRGKRWLDLALSIPALIVLAPSLLVIAILVRLALGAPVLFRQQRSGRHGKPFRILKFRTMAEKRDAAGARLPDAQRLTRLGRFLRAASLDELPEFFNVLKGEMSLVGPRPLIPRYLPYYSATERKRFERLPGVTGWAQVNGRNSLGWDERLAQDAWYVDACSLRLDLKILCRTVWKVLLCADVHVDTAQVIRPLDEERQRASGNGDGLTASATFVKLQ
jgi:glycosyltransferase involved in cell wall biosynthesis